MPNSLWSSTRALIFPSISVFGENNKKALFNAELREREIFNTVDFRANGHSTQDTAR